LPPRYEFDREYIDRLLREDPDVERHFTRYFGDLLTIKLRSRLRSPAAVDDVKQETFVRVLATLRKNGGLETPSALGGFVNSVCNNILMETYRAGARFTPLDETPEGSDSKPGAEANLITGEREARVRAALAELTPKDRTLLQWLFFDGRDKDDVCRTLNIDRNYLRVLLHRAKAHFKEQLGDAHDA